MVPDLANEQECDIQINPTPSPEQAEVSLINNRLSNIQTKSAVSRRFPDSEKQERSVVISDQHIVFICRAHTHPLSLSLSLPQSQFSLVFCCRLRKLLPASSRFIAEEMDDLEIKDKQIEKPQV